ncbi:hypothetical protein IF1G_07317 [Cordyceps javanica]|uniref:Uncharacterized protein n=1 Tax=Cordyceps javanica TaxID=43265 RepID=A0A545UVV0_9HYPO|nr:hypothetical protein IF1G_07317 [Cordyceps javanica]
MLSFKLGFIIAVAALAAAQTCTPGKHYCGNQGVQGEDGGIYVCSTLGKPELSTASAR